MDLNQHTAVIRPHLKLRTALLILILAMKSRVLFQRWVLSLVFFVMCGSVFAGTPLLPDLREEVRPNILLVMIDDCSAQEIACYGNPVHKTPVLDSLADSGIMIRTGWCTPLCSPTRALLMTGRYGFRTKWFSNDNKTNKPLPDNNLIFAQLLQSASYRTAIAGKWQLPGTTQEYGFDEAQLRAMGGNLPPGVTHPAVESTNPNDYNYLYPSRYWQPCIIRNGEYIPTTLEEYGPDMHTDFLIDFMSRNRDRPFLAYYSMVLTHDPFFPTPASIVDPGTKFLNDRAANFAANVEYMDTCIGRLIAALDTMGLRDNTIVLIVGDNGTAGVGKGKTTELGCRVPMIFNCPGTVPRLGPRDELIEFSDIFPTLAELAGTEVPNDYIHDGKSFAPFLLGGDYQERDWIYSFLDYNNILRDKRWLLEGSGSFFDCGDSRDGSGYIDVTFSKDPEVLEAKRRFDSILHDILPEYTVGLEVLDEKTNKPVAGCLVEIGGGSYTTGSDGRVEISLTQANYRANFIAPSYYPLRNQLIELFSSKNIVLTLSPDLFPNANIKISDLSTGDPIYRAMVYADDELFLTNHYGELVLQDLPQGMFVFRVEHPDYFPETDSVLINKTDTGISVSLTPKYADFIIRLTGGTGPVANARISCGSLTQLTGNEGTALFLNRAARKSYTYTIEKDGYPTVSDSFWLELDTTLLIDYQVLSSGGFADGRMISVYPNPAGSRIGVYGLSPDSDIVLLDARGTELRRYTVKGLGHMISLDGLPPGMYLFRIENKKSIPFMHY